LSFGKRFRDRLANHPAPTYGIPTLQGTGELLPRALEVFAKAVSAAGWKMEVLTPVRTPSLNAIQANRVWVSRSVPESWIAPLAAKKYLVLKDGRGWWSVSESVINAARDFGGNVIFTFLGNSGKIKVTHARAAKPEGDYLRFGERYWGWFIEEALELSEWLRDPELLSY